jgi:DNA-binding XRE family transcriptional regulator
MTNMRWTQKWLDEQDLNAILIATPDSRREYESERLFAQLSKALRRARKASQLSQTEVATLAGIKPRAVEQIETTQGVRSVSTMTIAKVARALHLRIDVTFTQEDD